MPETNVSKAIGVAGEYWVASTILFQGSEEGYRVCTVDVDDLGTDLFLAKYTNGILVKTYEVQVKTVRTLQHNNTSAAFSFKRPVHHGLNNVKRIYVLLYSPLNVKYCWVFTEKQIKEKYRAITTSSNITFSIKENARDRGMEFRCNPEDLFNKIKNVIENMEQTET